LGRREISQRLWYESETETERERDKFQNQLIFPPFSTFSLHFFSLSSEWIQWNDFVCTNGFTFNDHKTIYWRGNYGLEKGIPMIV